MVKVFYQLILAGDKTLADVPARIKEDVIQMLRDNGHAELLD